MSDISERYPEWVRQLHGWLPVSAQVVLTGRVDDVHIGPIHTGDLAPRHTAELVADCLHHRGFTLVLGWNPLDGAVVLHEDRADDGRAFLASHATGTTAAAVLMALVRAVVRADRRVGLVIQSAPRLAPTPEDDGLNLLYALARELAVTAVPQLYAHERASGRQAMYNTVIWTVSQEAELPHWLVAAEGMRVINIPDTTVATRKDAAWLQAPRLSGYTTLDERTQESVVDRLAAETDGMSLGEVLSTVPLARDRRIEAIDVENAVRFLRSGMAQSPWRSADLRKRISTAEAELNREVMGQGRAVRKAVSILARATLGLSGAQSAGHATRPQGVMFFAGPTGSGKTELAKQIARTVFGREEAMVRFDMSEFAAEQNEARLIGSPPGFVGHGAGGELTNAVRRNPFCLLLFDEIEKAHVSILDKFLQILEDGRLTDGSGNTVHFTETLIVFTSNMGIYQREVPNDPNSPLVRRVDPGDPYESIESTVLEAIKSEFEQIRRPELLNRIGDNIVVFDFISEQVAKELVNRNLNTLSRQLAIRSGFDVTFGQRVRDVLGREASTPDNLAFGGRRMSTLVESRMVNPLAIKLIEKEPPGPFVVTSIVDAEQARAGGPPGYEISLEPGRA